MGYETGFRDKIGRALRASCLIGAMALVAACVPAKPADSNQPSLPQEAFKIDNVDVRIVDGGLIVQYRTRTPVADCKAQAAEMPRVWNQVVNERLKDSRLQWVHLVPENDSGRSVGIEFTKNASGEWIASAPCPIRIPTA
jgi:hypothetical protein